ncbi:MAG: ComEC/Rec2 family competence protein, partial [Lachnospiraceae bacterium]|nr:ComEC/Rec2 family competence protein [Lachnospiraceae bacterium]
MRRPLCLLCLIYVFLIMLCMTFMSQKPEDRQDNDQNIRFCGKVYNMGVKNSHTVIYLKNSQEDISVICYLSENLENTSQYDSEDTSKNLSENASDCLSEYISKNSIGKKLKIGNTVVVQGKVRQFESATNDGQFDMKEYYAIMGIDFSMTGCSYEIVSETYWPVRHGLYVIKNSLSNVLDVSMSKEDAGVLKAMLFGDKTGMDEEIKELYQRNGIAHIIAVSGLHITLWGMGLCRLLRKIRIPLSVANSVSFLFVVMYGLLTGSQASAVRSIIMFSLFLFSEVVHRTYDLMTAMALSAALLLFWNPLYAFYSGFLLSFSAVAGIAFILPFITGISKQQKLIDAMVLKKDTIVGKIIKKIKKFIVSSFRVSLSVLLSTLPIQIYFFYTFSIYSLILNILITPFVGILMVVGMAGSVIGVIMPGMGKGILWFCHLILSGYEKLCLLFDNLPFAHPVIAKPEIHKIVIYYCVLFLLCLCSSDCGKRWMKKEKRRLTEIIPKYGRWIVVHIEKYRVFLVVLLLLLNSLLLCMHSVKDTTLTMLDVGQGDCFVLEEKGGLCMMIDGGSSSVSEVGKYRISPFLRSHGIQTLDFVFLTHVDKDHTNGVLELLGNQKSNRIVIRYLVLTDYAKENAAYQTLLSATQKSGT